MSCLINYFSNNLLKPNYIIAIYEDYAMPTLFDDSVNVLMINTTIKLKRTLYFNDLKELLYFPNKTSILGLDLSNQNMSDISFLYEFRGLETLNLENNLITDLSILQYLFKLKSLNISCNKIKNLNYLDRCLNLEKLFLSGNHIDDLHELQSLSELKILDISLTNIDNLDDLEELKKIEYIFIPIHVKTNSLEKKLKYKLIDKEEKGIIITSYSVYFNKIYKSCEGIKLGKIKFTL